MAPVRDSSFLGWRQVRAPNPNRLSGPCFTAHTCLFPGRKQAFLPRKGLPIGERPEPGPPSQDELPTSLGRLGGEGAEGAGRIRCLRGPEEERVTLLQAGQLLGALDQTLLSFENIAFTGK